MIERLNAAPVSFKGVAAIESPRNTFQEVIDKNEEIQQQQKDLLTGQKTPEQGQILDKNI